jgi:3-oxoacyl-[acyl-carrier protein] reductase
MNKQLKGKTAIVTGASKGIGLAIASALADHGVDTLICGRDRATVDHAVTRIKQTGAARIIGTSADVGAPDQVRALFELADRELGSLDILVNCAGIGTFRATGEMKVEEWDRMIATNLSGAFYCSREAIQRFEGRKGGFIINISSLAGRNPFAGGAAYNASKYGLNGFSEAMMLDHRNDNIRVSYIMPGSVDTGFGGHSSSPDTSWKIAPEDIAGIVLHVLSMPERTLISRVEVRPSRPPRN